MTDNRDRIAADPNKVDAIKLSPMLTDLRLPTINQLWQSFAKRADAEGWTAARFLATLVEHELAERDRRRIERHLRQARPIPGKTLDAFDFSVVPMISKAQVNALAVGDAWLDQGANCLIFGPPGVGKSHLASAIGLAPVENGYRVFFTRTTDLVQRMQVARRELALEAMLARLDRYHLPILDDIAYVQKDRAETSVLFELISARYERRSLPITANQPFGDWNRVFPDETTAVGLCVASGVVEGGCKNIVGARLKQGGMRWTVDGANAIIALRCAVESNRFDDFWERHASARA